MIYNCSILAIRKKWKDRIKQRQISSPGYSCQSANVLDRLSVSIATIISVPGYIWCLIRCNKLKAYFVHVKIINIRKTRRANGFIPFRSEWSWRMTSNDATRILILKRYYQRVTQNKNSRCIIDEEIGFIFLHVSTPSADHNHKARKLLETNARARLRIHCFKTKRKHLKVFHRKPVNTPFCRSILNSLKRPKHVKWHFSSLKKEGHCDEDISFPRC